MVNEVMEMGSGVRAGLEPGGPGSTVDWRLEIGVSVESAAEVEAGEGVPMAMPMAVKDAAGVSVGGRVKVGMGGAGVAGGGGTTTVHPVPHNTAGITSQRRRGRVMGEIIAPALAVHGSRSAEKADITDFLRNETVCALRVRRGRGQWGKVARTYVLFSQVGWQ